MLAVTAPEVTSSTPAQSSTIGPVRHKSTFAELRRPEPGLATISPQRSARESRHRQYARRLTYSDATIICLSVVTARVLEFSGDAPPLSLASLTGVGDTAVSCVLVLLWMTFLAQGSRSPRVAGRGAQEYVVLVAATLQLFGLIAIASMLLRVDMSRGYLAIALPLGLVGLVANRWAWSHVAARARLGKKQDRLLIVGTAESAHDITSEFAKDPRAGYHVVGVCTPDGPGEAARVISVGNRAIPVVGTDQAILEAVRRTGVHTVALAATHNLRPVELRRLMWDLEALHVDLMIAPGLIDIVDQRLHSQQVAGMAMLEVVRPQYSRANSSIKRSFDVVFALAALAAVAPVMLVTALAVRFSSAGPTFYRSERIGMDGVPFRMIKFRSMYADADARMPALIAANDNGNILFFKVKDDPRVTRVGKIIRRFSVDELPQFLNVLRGDMSVVGPRPQVRREVDSYDDLVYRRLAVKPGLTGLWQISGRSDLEVEDAIRLDLTYVENWSLGRDVAIIVKTVRTVLLGSGAY